MMPREVSYPPFDSIRKSGYLVWARSLAATRGSSRGLRRRYTAKKATDLMGPVGHHQHLGARTVRGETDESLAAGNKIAGRRFERKRGDCIPRCDDQPSGRVEFGVGELMTPASEEPAAVGAPRR